MKKLENLKEILKDAPIGLKLYSPAYGDVYFQGIENLEESTYIKATPRIVCKSKSGNEKTFFLDGTISTNGECMLFPDDSKSWFCWQDVLIKVGNIVKVEKNMIGEVVDILSNQAKVKDSKNNISTYYLTDCEYASKEEIKNYRAEELTEYITPLTDNKQSPAKIYYLDKNTTVINLIGGPGCGKSTVAAGLFYEMKRMGISCELVCEYAKEKVWEESFNTMKDEIYLFAKQLHKQWRLKGKVHFIITDHCLLNSVIYDKKASPSFVNLVFEEFNKFNNINFFIMRGNKYETVGRIETEEESIKLDQDFKDLFNKNNITCKNVSCESAINEILKSIGLNKEPISYLNPHKLDLGDIVTVEDGKGGWKIVSIIRRIINDELYDVVRLTVYDDGKNKIEINPINALSELDKCQFSYRKANDDEVELLYDEMNDQGWAWNSDRKIIEVFDI